MKNKTKYNTKLTSLKRERKLTVERQFKIGHYIMIEPLLFFYLIRQPENRGLKDKI